MTVSSLALPGLVIGSIAIPIGIIESVVGIGGMLAFQKLANTTEDAHINRTKLEEIENRLNITETKLNKLTDYTAEILEQYNEMKKQQEEMRRHIEEHRPYMSDELQRFEVKLQSMLDHFSEQMRNRQSV